MTFRKERGLNTRPVLSFAIHLPNSGHDFKTASGGNRVSTGRFTLFDETIFHRATNLVTFRCEVFF